MDRCCSPCVLRVKSLVDDGYGSGLGIKFVGDKSWVFARLDDAGYDDQCRLGKSSVIKNLLIRQGHRPNTEHSQKGGTTSMKLVNEFQSYHKESRFTCTKIS